MFADYSLNSTKRVFQSLFVLDFIFRARYSIPFAFVFFQHTHTHTHTHVYTGSYGLVIISSLVVSRSYEPTFVGTSPADWQFEKNAACLWANCKRGRISYRRANGDWCKSGGRIRAEPGDELKNFERDWNDRNGERFSKRVRRERSLGYQRFSTVDNWSIIPDQGEINYTASWLNFTWKNVVK